MSTPMSEIHKRANVIKASKSYRVGASLHTGGAAIGSGLAYIGRSIGSSIAELAKGVRYGQPKTTQQIVRSSIKRANARKTRR